MGVEALGWAFRQNIPAKAKIVLLALADQTDEETGRVCYGKTDAAHLSRKATCGERTLYRYLSALIRNRYVVRESGRKTGGESRFWLCLDRISTDLKEWSWGKDILSSTDSDKPQDIGGLPPEADLENTTQPIGTTQEHGTPRLPPSGRAESFETISTSKEQPRKARPSGFDPKAQAIDRQAATAKDEKSTETSNPLGCFVMEGTKAWQAWRDYNAMKGQKFGFTYRGEGKYRGFTGRHMPTLFPPATPTAWWAKPEPQSQAELAAE